jgi:membrane protein DedA with SNARE-associated domain
MEHFLSSSGYVALVVLAFIEACCVPIPSEVTFGFAGVLAGEHRLDLALVIVLGTLFELVGSFVAYFVGRLGGRPLVERLGRYLLVTSNDLDRAERFFSGRGELAVVIGRAMPVVRAFVSIAAGIAKMPPLRFGVCSFIGTLVYACALSGLGYGVGSQWHRVVHDFSLAGYVLVVVVVAVVALWVWHRVGVVRREREENVRSSA